MYSGFYTIASGLLTAQRDIDVIGDNMVNVQTPGYRAGRLIQSSFEQELLMRLESGNSAVLGDGFGATANIVADVASLFHSGMIDTTDRTLDVAINGEGFFNIEGADGTLYQTRNGQFDIDAEGYLVLPGYGRVLGEDGPLQVGTGELVIGPEGNIYDIEGTELGQLQVSVPPENVPLSRDPNGLFTLPEGTQQLAASEFTVAQGALERSNVDLNREMTNLIAAQRAFEVTGSALQIIDSLNRKAATEIGSI